MPTATKPKNRKPKARRLPPTLQQFQAYQAAYDHFNRKLFDAKLSPCLLVFREGRRSKRGIVLGHFAWHRWENAAGELIHEISLSPDALKRPLLDVMSTLVHEMVHQQQQDHGTPPRPGYHDKEWAHLMCNVGLIPTDTGEPGGKMTGQSMTHLIQTDGPFERAFKAMPTSIRLPWIAGYPLVKAGKKDGEGDTEAKTRNKIKYVCSGCKSKVWGKPDLKILCGECDEQFEAA